MSYRQRMWGLLAVTALAVVAVYTLLPPIGQDPAYHDLADRRVVLGIPRFGDVVSNLAFTIVGLAGLGAVFRGWFAVPPLAPLERMPFAAFFLGVALVGPGSAWYHLEPNTTTLFWDRLPMTVAFMGLVAAVIADRIDARRGAGWGLALLILAGAASVVGWSLGEARGAGDLRAYILVQFYPLIGIPLVLWAFPVSTRVHGRHIAAAVVLYALAKLGELYDQQIFALTGELVSGHTLKHLVAALAPAAIIAMLRYNPAAAQPAPLRA